MYNFESEEEIIGGLERKFHKSGHADYWTHYFYNNWFDSHSVDIVFLLKDAFGQEKICLPLSHKCSLLK
jgi:hypothetical protein